MIFRAPNWWQDCLAPFAVILILTLSACGGSGSPSTAATEASGVEEPSAEFAGKGENGELATAGAESSFAERQAASRVVEESLKARAELDFAGQCETLAPELVKRLEERGSKGIVKQSCAQGLEAMGRRAAPESFKNPMTEPLAALRVNGNLAFAFFHGKGGNNYVVPMEKEGSEWKVASLEVQETP